MNKDFWKAALIRAVRTIAQSMVSMIAVGAAISEVQWLHVLSVSAVAGLLSLLTSIATGLPETEKAVEYRYLDENGVHVDGHYVLVHNVEEDVNEECGACDISAYLNGDGEEK